MRSSMSAHKRHLKKNAKLEFMPSFYSYYLSILIFKAAAKLKMVGRGGCTKSYCSRWYASEGMRVAK
jgi:hypothetical protein